MDTGLLLVKECISKITIVLLDALDAFESFERDKRGKEFAAFDGKGLRLSKRFESAFKRVRFSKLSTGEFQSLPNAYLKVFSKH